MPNLNWMYAKSRIAKVRIARAYFEDARLLVDKLRYNDDRAHATRFCAFDHLITIGVEVGRRKMTMAVDHYIGAANVE